MAQAVARPHTLHPGSLLSLTLRHCIASASSSSSRPLRAFADAHEQLQRLGRLHEPMMPTSGANTPITAQRISSRSPSSGNRQ